VGGKGWGGGRNRTDNTNNDFIGPHGPIRHWNGGIIRDSDYPHLLSKENKNEKPQTKSSLYGALDVTPRVIFVKVVLRRGCWGWGVFL
jgi:hypothetical protein